MASWRTKVNGAQGTVCPPVMCCCRRTDKDEDADDPIKGSSNLSDWASEVVKPQPALILSRRPEPADEGELFLADDSELRAGSDGLGYRSSARIDDLQPDRALVRWGDSVRGVRVGESWVRVGKLFLPVKLRGCRVLVPLTPRGKEKGGEAVLKDLESSTTPPSDVRAPRNSSTGSWQTLTLALLNARRAAERKEETRLSQRKVIETRLNDLIRENKELRDQQREEERARLEKEALLERKAQQDVIEARAEAEALRAELERMRAAMDGTPYSISSPSPRFGFGFEHAKREHLLREIERTPRKAQVWADLADELDAGEYVYVPFVGRGCCQADLFLKALELEPKSACFYSDLGSVLDEDQPMVLIDGVEYGERELYVHALELDSTLAVTFLNLADSLEEGETVRLKGEEHDGPMLRAAAKRLGVQATPPSTPLVKGGGASTPGGVPGGRSPRMRSSPRTSQPGSSTGTPRAVSPIFSQKVSEWQTASALPASQVLKPATPPQNLVTAPVSPLGELECEGKPISPQLLSPADLNSPAGETELWRVLNKRRSQLEHVSPAAPRYRRSTLEVPGRNSATR